MAKGHIIQICALPYPFQGLAEAATAAIRLKGHSVRLLEEPPGPCRVNSEGMDICIGDPVARIPFNRRKKGLHPCR